MNQFVVYLRVSTAGQGRSGLGLDAQQAAVSRYLAERPGEVLETLTEVESGARGDRPALARALRRCRLSGATLVVAKLDRLSRDQGFIHGLRDAGVAFVVADMPEANTLTIGVMAAMAEYERELISERTRAGVGRGEGAGRGARGTDPRSGPEHGHGAGAGRAYTPSSAAERGAAHGDRRAAGGGRGGADARGDRRAAECGGGTARCAGRRSGAGPSTDCSAENRFARMEKRRDDGVMRCLWCPTCEARLPTQSRVRPTKDFCTSRGVAPTDFLPTVAVLDGLWNELRLDGGALPERGEHRRCSRVRRSEDDHRIISGVRTLTRPSTSAGAS